MSKIAKNPDGMAPSLAPICRKTKQILEERGISQTALAKGIKVLDNRISKWLNEGVGVPDYRQAWAMADFLDVDPLWLLDDGVDGKPPRKGQAANPLTNEELLLLEIARRVDDDPATSVSKTIQRLLRGPGEKVFDGPGYQDPAIPPALARGDKKAKA